VHWVGGVVAVGDVFGLFVGETNYFMIDFLCMEWWCLLHV